MNMRNVMASLKKITPPNAAKQGTQSFNVLAVVEESCGKIEYQTMRAVPEVTAPKTMANTITVASISTGLPMANMIIKDRGRASRKLPVSGPPYT